MSIAQVITATEIAFDQFISSLVIPKLGELNSLLKSSSITLKLQLWPNPFAKTLNLHLSKTDKVDSFSIHDMIDKMIGTIKENHSLRQQLNIWNLQTNVYMLAEHI